MDSLPDKIGDIVERKVLIMLLTLFAISPLLFTGWCVGKTASITKDFVSYEMKLSDAKRNDPEKYRKMKEKEAEVMSPSSRSNIVVMHMGSQSSSKH